MAQDENRLFASLDYELRDGAAGFILQRDGALENELLLLRCEDGVEAFGTDVQLMRRPRVVEGGAALHAEMNGTADGFGALRVLPPPRMQSRWALLDPLRARLADEQGTLSRPGATRVARLSQQPQPSRRQAIG